MTVAAVLVSGLYLLLALRHLYQLRSVGGLNIFDAILTFLFLGCLAVATLIGFGGLFISWLAGAYVLGFVAFVLVGWLYIWHLRFRAEAASRPQTSV